MSLRVLEHDAAHERFRRTLRRGRLASTYLFVGPDGVGKRRFARLLAAALLCGRTRDADLAPCGECESCRLLAAGNHPDLIEVARPADKAVLPIELFIGDKEHRNQQGLCHEISLKPCLGGRRVAIIDDADDLNVESANCLLKTLEEPPPHSLLILIGRALSRQLPTIRSRCQVVRFDALSEDAVERVLVEAGLLDEGEDAPTLASRAGGSLSRALESRDAAAEAFYAMLTATLGQPGFDPIKLAADAVAFSGEGGTEPAQKRARLAGLLNAAIGSYRDAMVAGPGAGDATDAAVRCLDACLVAEAALARNANQATLVQAWLTDLWRVQRPRS